MKNVTFFTGDNVSVMQSEILDDSIDLTVTSPPYDDLRTYNGFDWDIDGVVEQLWRVTKKGGVVVWVVGDKTNRGSETGSSFRTALRFMDSGWRLHDTMIYEKSTSPFPQSNRYTQKFEYMFVFSKGVPATTNISKESAESNLGRLGKKDGSYRMPDGRILPGNYESRKSIKNKGNIWYYAVGNNCSTKDKVAFQHPAIFPEKLAEDHILSWSNEGETVLDIFGGSGTTAKMALLNKRKSIYIDISEKYTELAKERVSLYTKEEAE